MTSIRGVIKVKGVLLWIYYSAQIVLFGAEFTQVYARRHGSLQGSDVVPTSPKTSPPTVNGPASVQPGVVIEPAASPVPPSPAKPSTGNALSGIVFAIGVFLAAMIANVFNRRPKDTSPT